MDATATPSTVSLRLFARALGFAVMCVGALVLVGWALAVDPLKTLLPGYVAMKVNTAAGLLLAGASVTLHAALLPGRAIRGTARALAAAALGLGLLTLVEYALGVDLGIDHLLLRGGEDARVLARMPFSSALALSLLGASLLFLDAETPRGHHPSQAVALAAGIIPLQAFVGYLYGLEPTGGVSPYTQVAVHSGLAFGLLCVAVLLARPDRGIMRVVTNAGPAGFMARRLLVASVVIPLGVGWVFLVAGIRAGQYEAIVGATFVVVSAILTGGVVVWRNARQVQAMDEARTRAEEAVRDEREWLSTTLASIGDAVVAAGEDGRVKNLNAVAEALTGWASDDAAGRRLEEVFRVRGPAGTPVEDPADWAARQRRPADLPRDAVLVARSGAEFPIEGCVSPIRDGRGGTFGVVVVFRDIRDRQELERQRARLLAREQEARAGAEQASRAKDEFIATLSHELRTPLNSVLGWARLLRIGKLDPDGVRRAVEAIERGATTQAQIVDDLLDVSRIVRGQLKLDVRPVDLVPIVEAAIDTVRPAAAAREIEIAAVLAPRAGPVAGDPGRLQQVLWNLLANAIKFTPPGGRVEVRLEQREGRVEIVVRDTGSGITPDFLPHVFERFRQADSSTTRAHGGLGLGLAIVRHLVEAHGGTVSAAPGAPGGRGRALARGPPRVAAPGGPVSAARGGRGAGSTFVVALPATPPRPRPRAAEPAVPAPAPAQPAAAPASLERLRVLLVDDDQDTLEVVKQLLEQAGAEVTAASSAPEALRCLEAQVPDVLVSDIGMPGQDGYALIREVRRRGPARGGDVPAAALTAFTQGDTRQEALRAGFQLYLAKPIDPAELTQAVATLAARAQPAGARAT